MTTDLRDKTVEELREIIRWMDDQRVLPTFDELARRLSEAQQLIAERDAAQAISVKDMVDRFLSWKLPEDFYPDGGITFKRLGSLLPIGTNLFTAVQAEQMFLHCLPASAKHDAAIIKAAEEVPDINDRKDGVFLPTQKFWNAIGVLCQAVRAKGEKV